MEKSSRILLIALIVVLGILLAYAKFGPTKANMDSSGVDIFNGVITNMKLAPGNLTGTGVYDQSCNPIENGLTQCDAGIQTSEGLLNFNYKHNMQTKPCISLDDKLEVEIIDSDGNAIVRRLK